MSIFYRKLKLLAITGLLTGICLLTIAASSPAARASSGSTQASADLDHTPVGSTSLKWDPGTEQLTVTIMLTGLAPKSTHPAHIHKGDCSINGPILFMLNDVVADAAGTATSTTTIADVEGGIPASGWYINVHNGPGLKPADQFTPIACANIMNSDTETDEVQNVTATLGATNAANQSADGMATLTLDDETLTVVVTLHGLVPGSKHAAHIHAGSCESQLPGKVVFMLNNVVADDDGNATVTTVINDVESIPASGWYVNVHFSTDLSTQTGFDPIACGNVEA
ncbi:MAG TPA: CHRD domain-containing protein [Ktedonosporobacter sp.]|nr:CHRD domain-containing protein [Ktedonosporobacter sp.]